MVFYGDSQEEKWFGVLSKYIWRNIFYGVSLWSFKGVLEWLFLRFETLYGVLNFWRKNIFALEHIFYMEF